MFKLATREVNIFALDYFADLGKKVANLQINFEQVIIENFGLTRYSELYCIVS